ncbi:MAG: hypothetical protein IKO93_02060 [Lentisphaeria bacterium]|nr:hypothetical protein [Lentisphaeria bacterium]
MENKLSRLEEQNQALQNKLQENQAAFDKLKEAREKTLNELIAISTTEEIIQ